MATPNTQLADWPDKPNGPVAAALLAAGIGATLFGIIVFIADLFANVATALNWYAPVGPLTGKVVLGMLIYFVAWGILHFMWRGKEVDFKRIGTIAFVLLALGLLFTFPLFWDIFPKA